MVERSETPEERDGSRRKKEQEAFEIVARDAMSVFVLQSQAQLLAGKRMQHGSGDHQAWPEDTHKRQERAIFFNYDGLSNLTR
jgi:hypothetical protein